MTREEIIAHGFMLWRVSGKAPRRLTVMSRVSRFLSGFWTYLFGGVHGVLPKVVLASVLLAGCGERPLSEPEYAARKAVKVVGLDRGAAWVQKVTIDGQDYIVAIGSQKVGICPATKTNGGDSK